MSAPRPTAPPLEPRPERLAEVKLIGAGGIGGIVARYAALWLASLDVPARLVVIDGDVFEPANAARMLFSSHGNKAAVLCDELADAVGDSSLSLVAVERYVDAANLPALVRPGDVVLLAVDNHATRKLVSDHARSLEDVCLISGGNDGVGPDSTGRVLRGTYGNVQVHARRGGEDLTPPLTRFHPEIEQPADRTPGDLACTEALASTPQILFANLSVASAMLATLWLWACDALHYAELSLDVHDARMRPLPWALARRG